ncbi:MAG: hypothetical protein ACOZDY_06045 [Pseudomonadota bacterium]
MTSSLADFPERVRGPAGAPAYRRLDGWYALVGSARGAPPHAEFTLEGGAVAVLRGAPPARRSAGAQVVAVYSPGGAEIPCVPTGRVLLRFPDHERAADHRRDVEAAGCVIVEALAYAPQAAWVAAASGTVADALRALDALAAIPGVVAIEPQMLQRRARR